MTALLRALNAEIMKMKRTLALLMVLVTPGTVVALQFFTLLQRGENMESFQAEPWNVLAQGILGLWAILMLPLFITLETALLAGMEHGTQQWKHLFALPVPRWTIYAAKLLVSAGLIALSTLTLVGGIVAAGLALQALLPGVSFPATIPLWDILRPAVLIFLTAGLILAIHTWVSLRWASFTVAVSVGIVATVGGAIIGNSLTWWKYYPWALAVNVISGPGVQDLPLALTLGIGGGIVVGVLGCWDVVRRDVVS